MQKIVLLVLTLFTTTGCATGMAMMAMNGFGACSPTEFKQAQLRSSVINHAYVGQSVDDIISQAGQPQHVHNIQTATGTAEVLEYQTGAIHCRAAREDIKIIVQNGVVTGIGADDYQRLRVANFDRYPIY